MHLTLSLTGHGFHPAGWRQSSAPALPGYRAPLQRAEAAGLDAVLLGPALGSPALLLSGGTDAVQLDPMPLLGSLVPHSQRIGLGAAVFMSHTEPFHTARAFAVLDNLSAGRTAWCVDTLQLDQAQADFAHRPSPPTAATRYARALEYIQVVKQLWDSWQDDTIIADKASGIFAHGTRVHRIDHVGEHFTVRGPLTALRPRQGRPVIVQWDMSAEGLALAAATADVFLATCLTLDEAQAFSAGLRAATAAAGRDPAALRTLLNVTPILAASTAAAEDRAALLDAAITPALATALRDEAGAGASRSALRFTGTATALAELMTAWVAAGACDGWNLRPAVLPDDLDALLGELAPALQRAGQLRQDYVGATLREHLGLARPVNPNAA